MGKCFDGGAGSEKGKRRKVIQDALMSRYCCGFIPPEDSWETLVSTSQGHPPQGVRKLGYWSTKSYSKLAEGYLRGGRILSQHC